MSQESLADPGGRQGRAQPGSKFFHFHAVFGKKFPIWELAHSLGKILDLPLKSFRYLLQAVLQS